MIFIRPVEHRSETVCAKKTDSLWYEAIAQPGGAQADAMVSPA